MNIRPEDEAAFFGRSVHFPHLPGIHAGRFFTEDMASPGKGLDRQRRVIVVGRCDDHGVDSLRPQQFVSICECLDAFAGPRLRSVQLIRIDIADGLQHRTRYFVSGQAIDVVVTHVPDANDTDANDVHRSLLPAPPARRGYCLPGEGSHLSVSHHEGEMLARLVHGRSVRQVDKGLHNVLSPRRRMRDSPVM